MDVSTKLVILLRIYSVFIVETNKSNREGG